MIRTDVTRYLDALDRTAVRLQAGSRGTKWRLYQELLPPRLGERVLDVGVSSLDDLPGENDFIRRYPYPDQLTAVGIDDLGLLEPRYPKVKFLRADGRRLPFPDKSFDVVHSNAVIEHVGPRKEQARFVAELVRVARAGFITTPNRWFPVETHCRLPLLHWLPRPIVERLARTLREPDLGWWLLSGREFAGLLPTDVGRSFHRTRILGWPVTLIIAFGAAAERLARPSSTSPRSQ